MSVVFRIPRNLEQEIRKDLMRPHTFAAERIGFIFTRSSHSNLTGLTIVLATGYEPVADADYVEDPCVGARINSAAIRKVMQRALNTGEGAFHVHIHDHRGAPGLSYTDKNEIRPMMLSVRNAAPLGVHGLLVISQDAGYLQALLPGKSDFREAVRISVVGFPMAFLAADSTQKDETERFTRQSFLGPAAERSIASTRVGIIGLGGGGSHIAQQLAHVGFSNFALFDQDIVECSNLNRLVGATTADVKRRIAKVDVASRQIKNVNPKARIEKVKSRWQDAPDLVRACDIVFGCVDGFDERRDIEIATRRYLIPYIDIGLDVHQYDDEPPQMAGQVIVSMPNELCMSCLGFLTPARFAREAERYGVAGPRPQVVWANGILASTAVGIAIDLITDWTRLLRTFVYLSYDSNTGTIKPHNRLQYIDAKSCPHFPSSQIGDPVFRQL